MTVSAVIFDMDGLMFDTEALNFRAWHAAGEKHGFDITEEKFAPCIGVAVPTARRILEETFGPGFDFNAVRNDRIEWAFSWIAEHGMPEKPGLRELLSWLEGAGIKKAVATSSPRNFIDFYFEHTPPLSFDSITTWEQGMQGKPAPDIFLAAAKKLNAEPESCVVLEDSYNGIRAAHAAGMIPIMVPDRLPPTPEIMRLAWRKADTLSGVIPLIEELNAE